MNRKHLFAAAAVVVVGVAVWRMGVFDTDSKKVAAPAVPVVVAEIKSSDVPLYVTGIGTVQAYSTVLVRPRVDGELTNVAFREGQQVKKGEMLAQIDSRPFRAALDTALAALAKDEATLANAKRDLARTQEVAQKGYASRQQLDSQTSQVASLTAAVQADKALAETARIQLGYTTIVSPLDGRAGIRQIDQGNVVRAADANGLVTITQTQPIAAVFTLPQRALGSVVDAQGKGKPLRVTALSRDDAKELSEGALELIDNQIDPSTGTIRLKAYFPNTDNKLWPGEFITARLQLGDKLQGVTVLSRAVVRGANGPFAYAVKADNTVELRQLELGAEFQDSFIVKAGLKAGDKVVADGQLRLAPGSAVKIVEVLDVAGGKTAPVVDGEAAHAEPKDGEPKR